MSNPIIKEAINYEAMFAKDDNLRRQYEAAEKARRDQNAVVNSAIRRGLERGIKEGIEQGLKQGLKQGLEQGVEQGLKQGVEQGLKQGVEQGLKQGFKQQAIETAKSMLADNMDISLIMKYSGLSRREIDSLLTEK